MNVQILGMGCPKCNTLESNAAQAISELGMDAQLTKIADMQEIMKMGVMMTPALAVDNVVKTKGKLLTTEEIKKILQESL